MTMFDRIKELSKKRGKNLKQVALELGFGENYFYTVKKQSPKAETLEQIANYFDVSVDYLLGRTDNPSTSTDETKKELTVEEALKSVMSYDGQPLTENDRDVLAGIIEAYLAKSKK